MQSDRGLLSFSKYTTNMIILIDGEAYLVDDNSFNKVRKENISTDGTGFKTVNWTPVIEWVERNGDPYSSKKARKQKNYTYELKRGVGEVKPKKSQGARLPRFILDDYVPTPRATVEGMTIRWEDIRRQVNIPGGWKPHELVGVYTCMVRYRNRDLDIEVSAPLSVLKSTYDNWQRGEAEATNAMSRSFDTALEEIRTRLIDLGYTII